MHKKIKKILEMLQCPKEANGLHVVVDWPNPTDPDYGEEGIYFEISAHVRADHWIDGSILFDVSDWDASPWHGFPEAVGDRKQNEINLKNYNEVLYEHLYRKALRELATEIYKLHAELEKRFFFDPMKRATLPKVKG